jgi:hypothetical protein
VRLPGRLEAEDYAVGANGVAYFDTTKGNTGGKYRTDDVDIETCRDTGGGFNVGWGEPGEWLEYPVVVTAAGNYTITARMASGQAGPKTMTATLGGVPLATFVLPQGSGTQSWQDVQVTNVRLPAGAQRLRLNMLDSGINLNYLQFILQPNVPPVASAGTTQMVPIGEMVTLDGSGSRDPDDGPAALTYVWTQVSGPPVSLFGAHTNQPVFRALQTGNYSFKLTVSDGAAQSSDMVLVQVIPRPRVQLDRNGDGISDVWAALYRTSGAPEADPDGDGVNNDLEAQAGTDPMDPDSVFVAEVQRLPDGQVELSWWGVSGKYYAIEESTDLAQWRMHPIEHAGADARLVAVVQEAGATETARRFWRVVVFDRDSDGNGLTDWEQKHEELIATVTASVGPNGEIAPSGVSHVVAGDTLEYRIVPEAGHAIDAVVVDGTQVGPVAIYRFEGIKPGTHTIVANFKSLVPVNLALRKPVTVSSTENGYPGHQAVDGVMTTRWSSEFSDPQWLRIDLQQTCLLSRIELEWEAAYARRYRIETSLDGSTWTLLHTRSDGDGGLDAINVAATVPAARYVRIWGLERATQWGYSLWEVRVWGTPSASLP